jgi:hypothetical protein
MIAGQMHDVCGVHFPGVRQFLVVRRAKPHPAIRRRVARADRHQSLVSKPPVTTRSPSGTVPLFYWNGESDV